MSQDPDQPPSEKSRGFFANVLWTWTGLLINLAGVLILTPYLIRGLGDEAYGIWTLGFSVAEYYTLLDGGFKSAVIRYAGGHRARGEFDQVNVVMNTALIWFVAVAGFLCAFTWLTAGWASRFFQVSESLRGDFTFLLLAAGTAWSLSLVGLVFIAGLEAFQQFHLTSRLVILNGVLRTTALISLLAAGHGLREMGLVAAGLQLLFYSLSAVLFMRVFPAFRFSPGLASRNVLKKLLVFGWDTVPSTLAWLLLLQGPGILIGRMVSASWVGYYSFPQRLAQQAINLIHNVGSVTTTKSAELTGKGEMDALVRMAVRVNRGCFTLYGAFAVLMVLYGRDLLTVWLNRPSLVDRAAPILPILAVGLWLSDAGQFNTSSMLFGMGRHRWFSRLLLLESLIVLAAIGLLLNRFGLMGAAYASAAGMVAHRGLLLPWLFCREMKTPWTVFMRDIYLRPLAAGTLTLAVGAGLRSLGAVASNVFQLTVYGGSLMGIYLLLVWQFVMDADDRRRLYDWTASRLTRK